MMATPITNQSVSAFKCHPHLVKPITTEPVKALFPIGKIETPKLQTSDKPYHFLLVDDNIINLRILGRTLKRLFPRALIRSVQDSSVLELTEESFSRFDCVFLDIDMPLVTGIDIATKLRSFPTLDHVGLVAVTTRALLSDMELYDSIGFDHTFPKPLNVRSGDLLNKIEQVVSVRGALRTKSK